MEGGAGAGRPARDCAQFCRTFRAIARAVQLKGSVCFNVSGSVPSQTSAFVANFRFNINKQSSKSQ